MISNKNGATFRRGNADEDLVYKHEKFFIIGHFGTGYHPFLNIRYITTETLIMFNEQFIKV